MALVKDPLSSFLSRTRFASAALSSARLCTTFSMLIAWQPSSGSLNRCFVKNSRDFACMLACVTSIAAILPAAIGLLTLAAKPLHLGAAIMHTWIYFLSPPPFPLPPFVSSSLYKQCQAHRHGQSQAPHTPPTCVHPSKHPFQPLRRCRGRDGVCVCVCARARAHVFARVCASLCEVFAVCVACSPLLMCMPSSSAPCCPYPPPVIFQGIFLARLPRSLRKIVLARPS